MLDHSLCTIADLEPGDHLCCLYETEAERRMLLMPFLCQGLERGEKVLYVVDACLPETILGYLRDGKLDMEPYWPAGNWPSSPATTHICGMVSLIVIKSSC